MSMDTPQFGLLLGATVARHEAESARPWAPQVPRPSTRPQRTRRARAPRTRRTLAGALHHLADAVAPASTVRGRSPGAMTAGPPGPAPATYPVPHGAEQGGVMSRVTLQTIADRVGVSRMTVSNAFSRPDQLSAEMRRTILAAAAELGYVGPDPSARALARGTTGAVGVLLTESMGTAFRDPIAAAFFGAVAEGLAPTGMAVVLLPSTSSEDTIPARDIPMDGALVYGCAGDYPAVDWLVKRQLPLVFVDGEPVGTRPACSSTSSTARGWAPEHLLALGHRRIGILTMNPAVRAGSRAGRRPPPGPGSSPASDRPAGSTRWPTPG